MALTLTFLYFQVWHKCPNTSWSHSMRTNHVKWVEESQQCCKYLLGFIVQSVNTFLDGLNRRSVWCLFNVGLLWDHVQERKEHKCATKVNMSPRTHTHTKKVKCVLVCTWNKTNKLSAECSALYICFNVCL